MGSFNCRQWVSVIVVVQGELVGVDRSTASRFIRGERNLTTSHIHKTADALTIAPELLIG